MKWLLGIVTLLIIVAAVLVVAIPAKAPTATPPVTEQSDSTNKAQIEDLIIVDSPLHGAAISSPLTITGRARGNFFFEASFPVLLADWDGKIIAQGHATAQGDWMTENFVPFKATLTDSTPMSGDPSKNRGTLILKNDNPSGDPAHDRVLEVPVVFK